MIWDLAAQLYNKNRFMKYKLLKRAMKVKAKRDIEVEKYISLKKTTINNYKREKNKNTKHTLDKLVMFFLF